MTRDLSRDTSKPNPYSTPDCDLRGLEWMPTETVNILESDLFLQSSGDEFKAAMALIWKSWRQVPAGSLPNDDRSLAILSSAPDWTSVRTMALHNWVLCADGRLYHPIVAAKAMEALPLRQQFVEKKTADSERKERERKDRKSMFARLREVGIVLHYSTKTTDLRDAIAALDAGKTPTQVTSEKPHLSRPSSRDLSRLGQGQDTTGTVKKKNPSGSTPDKPAKPARGSKRVPVDFEVTTDMVQWAATEAPHADLKRETEKFRDWEFAHSRTDWPATWRTWMRKASDSALEKRGKAAANGSGETPYQRSRREAVERATGGLASRKPPTSEAPHGLQAIATPVLG